MMLITSYFVDRKAQKVAKGRSVIEFLIRLLDWVYGPIARFRFRRGLSGALIEYTIYELAQMVARRVGAVVGKHNVQVSQTPKTEPRSGDLIRDRCAS